MALRFACLILVAMLAGCGESGKESLAGDIQGRTLHLRLSDLSGAEVLQFEIRGVPGTQLALQFSDVYSLNEDLPYCNVIGFEGQLLASLGAGQPFEIESNLGPSPTVPWIVDRGQFNNTAEGVFEIPASGRTVLTFGYDSAKQWLASGAQVELVVNADRDISWKPIGSGDMGCLNDYDDYPGGQYITSPVGSFAYELIHDFRLEHSGRVWIAPKADLGYSLQLRQDDVVLYADSKEANQSPDSFTSELGPGSYRLDIANIAGTTDTYVGLLYYDTACKVAG